jgi:hypothetical protein
MEAEDIERYLAELGTELKNRGLKKPVRVLLIGAHTCSSMPMHPVPPKTLTSSGSDADVR